MKKRIRLFVLLLSIVLLLCGCADISNYEIDYGHSSVYSQQEMDSAISEILKEFSTWDGCILYSITYTDDSRCKNEIDYCNELRDNENFDECIIFESTFHTPVNIPTISPLGGLEPNEVYTGWNWILARSNKGQWKLLTWGYG